MIRPFPFPFILCLFVFCASGSMSMYAARASSPSSMVANVNISNPNAGVVRHMVAFRFTNETTVDEAFAVQQMYLNLGVICRKDGAPYILSFDGGYPNSKEGFQQSMDQVYISTFSSVDDRDYFVGRPITYPYDPDHDRFKAFVAPYLYLPIAEGLIVLDFEVLDQL